MWAHRGAHHRQADSDGAEAGNRAVWGPEEMKPLMALLSLLLLPRGS